MVKPKQYNLRAAVKEKNPLDHPGYSPTKVSSPDKNSLAQNFHVEFTEEYVCILV